jgi:uncharacterized protein (DUF1697 family)
LSHVLLFLILQVSTKMPSVVFLRAANVGGHQTFKPSALAKQLADLGAVNIGAAGTFVIRATITPAKLRAEFNKRLQFEPEMMICRGKELLDLMEAEPFADAEEVGDAKRYVTILAKKPRTPPSLPLFKPEGDAWQVQVLRIIGAFALSLHRRMGERLIYPNEVIEKHFGLAATTRNWNTVEAIYKVLKVEK